VATYSEGCAGVGNSPGCGNLESWSRVYALDLQSGKVQWQSKFSFLAESTPAVTEEMVYLGTRTGLVGLSREDGVNWRLPIESRSDSQGGTTNVAAPPPIANERIFVGPRDGYLRAIGTV